MSNKKLLNSHYLISLSMFILFCFLVQCYTTFKHPQIYSYSDSTDVYLTEEVTYMDDCSSCHDQNSPVNDPHYHLYQSRIYEENYNWQYYYVNPWWIDEHYNEELEKELNEKLPATQQRNFDRRDIPPSPATVTPNSATSPSLSKPSTSEPAPPESPQPKKRHERRKAITKESSKSEKSATSTPTRKKRDQKETKKEKK